MILFYYDSLLFFLCCIFSRTPLQPLPENLKNDILLSEVSLESMKTSSKAKKWMRPEGEEELKDDLVSVIEQKMGMIRRVVGRDEEDDDLTDDTTWTFDSKT